jgi:hypothetical protein
MQPDESHWSVVTEHRVHPRDNPIPANGIGAVDPSVSGTTVHVISRSHAMLLDYDAVQAANWAKVAPEIPEDKVELAEFYTSEVTDATIAERWRSRVQAEDVTIPFGYVMLFHGLLVHAGAKGRSGESAMRLFLHYNHRDGPRYDSDPGTTYTVPICKTGRSTQKISDMLESMMG